MKLLSERRFRLCLLMFISIVCTRVYSAGLLRPIRAVEDNETITSQPTENQGSETSGASKTSQASQSPTPPGEPGGGDGVTETAAENVTKKPNDKRFDVAKFDFEDVDPFIIVALFIIFVVCAKMVIHSQEHLLKYFPESCILIVIGSILGIILYFTGAPNYQLNPHTFFLVILPPIIFDAGYYMPVRPFFDNLGSILSYAIMGTLLNALWLGFSMYGVSQAGGFGDTYDLPMLHLLTLASLLAAVDPVAVLAVFDAVQVNEVLHIVVFGEALLNDGIAVVLYRIFDGFSTIGKENIIGIDIFYGVLSFFVVVLCSPSIGYCFAVLAGFISRFTHHKRIFEPFIVFVIGYISFIFAEMLHLSGILSATFCGIAMRKYVDSNYNEKSKASVKYVLRTAALVSEGIIFIYIGVSTVNDDQEWDTGFILLTMAFCLVFRAVCTIVLSYLANLVRHRKLDAIDQFIMSYGGLRGAIAYALALELEPEIFKERKLFISTTVFVVYFTNIFLGTTIEPLVTLFRVARKDTTKPTMNSKIAERVFDYSMAGIESISGHVQIIQSYHNIKLKFSDWHTKYIRPLVVGKRKDLPGTHRGFEIRNIYMKLSEKDARDLVRTPSYATDISRIGSYIRRQNSTGDLSRADTETTLFNHALWSLPSFSVEGRPGGFDNQASIEDQLRQGAANSMDPAKYAKHYRRKIVSNASNQHLTEADLNEFDAHSEPSVRYRKNIGSNTDTDSGLVRSPSSDGTQSDMDWHQQSSAIEFVIGAKRRDTSKVDSPTFGQPDKDGYTNAGFAMESETGTNPGDPQNPPVNANNDATAAAATPTSSELVQRHLPTDLASNANQLPASNGDRNHFIRSGSYSEMSPDNNSEIPYTRNKTGSLDAGVVIKSSNENKSIP